MSNRIVFISNIILEPYLKSCIAKSFLSSAVHCVPYEEFNEKLIFVQNSDIIVICLNFDEIYPNTLTDISSKKLSYDDITRDAITRCRELYDSVKACSNAPIIWFGFEDYYTNSYIVSGNISALDGLVDKVNQAIREMMRDDVFVDLKRLIAKIGISNSFSIKGKYRWNAPYSKKLVELMADEVYKQYLIHTGNTKKCVVLDCDNVLWGGILSEDGIEGVRLDSSGLGREYQDFQRFLQNLYYHGVILAVCSKNDEEDVLRVFREHSGMLLKEEHVSCFQCNWNNKPNNIKLISDTLNIGLDSIVFVDDSRFEIEAVKSVLPEVTCVLYNRDTVYKDLSCFNLKSNINIQTIKERTETYKTNVLREELKNTVNSFDEYLSSLEMVIDIHRTLEHELSRISELTQRTNKCSNGTRYTIEELKVKFKMPEYHLYTVCLSDKFSDLGIVGVIGIENNVLDVFSLSCRALGCSVEQEMFKWIRQRNIKEFRFKNTGKNDDFFLILQKDIKCY